MVTNNSWKIFNKKRGFLYSVYNNTRNSLNKKLINYILNYARKKGNIIVLEAGSGPGQGSVFMSLKKNVKQAIALDHDKEALNSNPNNPPKLKRIVADMAKLPFPDKSVDVIWNNSTMEHLDNKTFNIATSEFSRVLKDDGYIFIGVPYKFGPLALSVFTSKKTREWVGRLFSKQDLEKRLSDFKIISSKIYFFGFFIGVICKKRK